MKAPRMFLRPLVFMIVVFGIIATLSSLLFSRKLGDELEREYESKALVLARSVAESDIHTILKRDATVAQSRIDQYLDIQGISYVLVADESGSLIAHTFVPVVPPEIMRLVTMPAIPSVDEIHRISDVILPNGDEYLHVSQPILAGLAGSVHIGMDRSVIKAHIRDAVFQQQMVTLVIFLGSVGLAYIFILSISRPIARLSEYARRVANHDFTAQLDIDSKDEVGQLGLAMRTMARQISGLINNLEDRVRKQTLELRGAKDALEQKVEERTSELSRANTQLKIEVAERRVIGEALRKAERKYRTIFENAVEGIYQITPSGRFLSANPALARIFGYASPDELMSIIHDVRIQLYKTPKTRDAFTRQLEKEGEIRNFQSRVRRKDGRIIWVAESARAVRDSQGTLIYYEGSVEDITLRKNAERQLKRQAFHDSLTNLPNRALFLDRLHMALARAKRHKHIFAVLYLDLDRFKVINDSLGHEVGDELLKGVSRVLESCARSMDTVARFGGDEFAVLLEEINAPRDAIRIARRILDGISQPFTLKGNEVFTSASIGIVLQTSGYDRPEALLRDADTAMYRAKEMGKSRFKVFNQKMHDQALKLMALETDLRRAVDLREFTVVYQPIVDIQDNRISGFEALVRWKHPEQGMISPTEFIPVAEDTGLIYPIDSLVLEKACETVQAWQDKHCTNGSQPLTLNLNLSGKHFGQTMLLNLVPDILARTGFDPANLNLELTESALVAHPQMAGEMLRQLKDLGLGIAIDDFGTGYSSLAYLQRFPIDVVKIDKSFISQVETDSDSRAIVNTIFSLGTSMNLKVVAEGVETESQLSFLREAECTFVQGFYFFKPMTEEQINEMFEKDGKLCCPG